MKNSKYWTKRAEEIAQIQYDKADELCKKIVKEYQKADKYITERINLYYARYADEYGVTLADSKKILSTSELRSFKMSLDEFREKALDNEDNKWTEELDEEYLRSRISRFDALKFEINNKINELSGKQTKDVTSHLKEVFEDTYSKTVTTFGENFGIGNDFASIDDKIVEQVIYSRWTNQDNFAGRISANKATLLSSLNKTITQGLIVGLSSDNMVKKLMKETKISRNRAINLIQTETTFMIGQANTKMYKDFGVEQYEVIETLDSSTCETCAEMDGKRFKVSEKKEGLNSPPFHPRCRGTTVPVSKYEHVWGESDRIARDDEGNTYYKTKVGDMSYEEYMKEKGFTYEFTSDINYDIKLTDNEQYAINKYISSDFYTINEKLRNDEKLSKTEEILCTNLDKALNKLPNYRGTVQRSLELDNGELKEFLKEHKKDNTVEYKAYTSTTLGPRYNDKSNVELYIIDSRLGKNMTKFNGKENEVLYRRNSKFIVDEIEKINDTYHILLREV